MENKDKIQILERIEENNRDIKDVKLKIDNKIENSKICDLKNFK